MVRHRIAKMSNYKWRKVGRNKLRLARETYDIFDASALRRRANTPDIEVKIGQRPSIILLQHNDVRPA